MIKTVKGVVAKLTTAREMGYRYCKVAVDGNNIGCALINDILDSINYCHTPGGNIRTFIHRGYEYAVDEGVEIAILSNKDFMEHYLGLPSSKDLFKTSEEAEAEVDERYLTKLRNESKAEVESRKRRQDVLSRMEKEISSAMNRSMENSRVKIVGSGTRLDGTTVRASRPKREGNGLFARLKKWLKGDIGYKR